MLCNVCVQSAKKPRSDQTATKPRPNHDQTTTKPKRPAYTLAETSWLLTVCAVYSCSHTIHAEFFRCFLMFYFHTSMNTIMKTIMKPLLNLVLALCALSSLLVAAPQEAQAQFQNPFTLWDQPKKIRVEALTASSATLVIQFDAARLADTLFSPFFGTYVSIRPERRDIDICYQIALDSTFKQTIASQGTIGGLFCDRGLLLLANSPLPPPNRHLDSTLVLYFPLADLRANTTYFGRARAASFRSGGDFRRTSLYSDTLRFTTPLGTSVRAEPPVVIALSSTPNPASDLVQLAWQQQRAGAVELTVVDMLGRVVQTHSLGGRSAGEQRTSLSVAGLPAGIYALRMEAGGQISVQRVVVGR
jgi:hypothetical protein